MKPVRNRLARTLVRAVAAAVVCCAAGAAETPAHKPAPTVFARVGDVVITQQEYDTAFAQASRSKFYHGKPPEAEIAAMQREVAQKMVNDVLLAQEAKRRKLQPDHAAVKKTIDGYEQKYQASATWKANRERLLPEIRAKLERDSVIEVLAKQVKAAGEPTPQQLQAYYDKHKDKFTSPEQVRVGVILLKVDPSSPKAKWTAATDEAAAILKRLKGGASFEELAKKHSEDPSAGKGGDMDYLHRGMLAEAAQEAIDKLKPGELTEPIRLLQGVGVFKLIARKPPQLNPLDAVRERARDLWARERGDDEWRALLERLRRETPVKIDESSFLALPVAAKGNEPTRQR